MEQFTSRYDEAVVRKYLAKDPRKSHKLINPNAETVAGSLSDTKGGGGLMINIPESDICKCQRISVPPKTYITQLRKFGPQHVHNLNDTTCKICCEIQEVFAGLKEELYNQELRSISVEGGAKARRRDVLNMASAADNMSSILTESARKVLESIYIDNPKVRTGEAHLTVELVGMKLSELNKPYLQSHINSIIAIIRSLHKSRNIKNPYEHPLAYILNNVEDLLKYMSMITSSYQYSLYQELANHLRAISVNYNPNLLLSTPLRFDPKQMVHPLLYALWSLRMPPFEDHGTVYENFNFISEMAITGKAPVNTSNRWAVLRWNERTIINFSGVDNAIDREIVRSVFMMALKRVITDIRSGNLSSEYSDKVMSIIKKTIVYSGVDYSDESEQTISKTFALLMIQPIKMCLRAPVMSMNNNIFNEENMDDRLKSSPYIYVGASSPFSIRLTAQTLSSGVNFSPTSDVALLGFPTTPVTTRLDTGPISTFTIEGCMPIVVKRVFENTGNPSQDGISLHTSMFEQMYYQGGRIYNLQSAVCIDVARIDLGKMTVIGQFALVKIGSSWLKYCPKDFKDLAKINEFRTKYMDSRRTKPETRNIIGKNGEVPHADDDVDDPEPEEPTADEIKNPADVQSRLVLDNTERALKDEFDRKFYSGYIDTKLLMITQEEAMHFIETQGILILYSENIETYYTRSNTPY